MNNMNGMIRKSSVILALCIFFMASVLGSVSAQKNPENFDFDSEPRCFISVFDGDVVSVERSLSHHEARALEHLLNVLSNVLQVLENPNKGFVGKMIAKLIGERTICVLKEKKYLPVLDKCDEMFDFFGIKRDKRWGIMTRIMGLGQGKVYIPLKLFDKGSIRPVFRPVFWYYPQKGITFARFGATYSWPEKNSMGYRGYLRGPQSGVMMGFSGVHFTIQHKLRPDTHFFIGYTLGIRGNNYCLKAC